MARPLRSEPGNNVVTICPKERSADDAGLTIEAVEFEVLDALPPFDDSGNIAWTFEGGPITPREKRWLELYAKKGGLCRMSARAELESLYLACLIETDGPLHQGN